MEKPVRVAMIMGKMVGGGVESVVMNYYRNINKKKIQFDFIIDNDSTLIPKKEIISMGGKVYEVSPYQKVTQYIKDIEKIFKKNKYKIVHSHLNTLSLIPLAVAKKCSIPIRIAHNHSTVGKDEYKKNIIKYVLRFFSTVYPTHYMAPIYKTGEWLFGKKVAEKELFILSNAFEVDKFIFNNEIRKKIRKKLGYSDKDVVLGNVGRIVQSKNQLFIIQLLNKIYKKNSNIKLLIIGDGPLKKKLLQSIQELGLTGRVSILTNVEDIENYYMAMDIFLFPSHYEGLGLVAVEAQTSGLPIISSDTLPSEIEITKLYYKIKLIDEKAWIDKIEQIMSIEIDRKLNIKKKLETSGFDINKESKKLVNFYYNALSNLYLDK